MRTRKLVIGCLGIGLAVIATAGAMEWQRTRFEHLARNQSRPMEPLAKRATVWRHVSCE